jgi:RNA polymerase sigma-70 factor (ECF subfamily)
MQASRPRFFFIPQSEISHWFGPAKGARDHSASSFRQARSHSQVHAPCSLWGIAMSQEADVLELELERHRAYLWVLARKHLDRHLWRLIDPSDVVHTTLLDAHCKRAQCQGQTEGERRAWLRTMLLNDLKDAIRKYGRIADHEQPIPQAVDQSSVWIDASLAAEQSSPSQQAMQHEELQRLATALAQLPEAERDVVTFHHLFDWTQAEVAAHLGRTRPAVAGLLRRGLKKLRKLLDNPE